MFENYFPLKEILNLTREYLKLVSDIIESYIEGKMYGIRFVSIEVN